MVLLPLCILICLFYCQFVCFIFNDFKKMLKMKHTFIVSVIYNTYFRSRCAMNLKTASGLLEFLDLVGGKGARFFYESFFTDFLNLINKLN